MYTYYLYINKYSIVMPYAYYYISVQYEKKLNFETFYF